MLKKALFGQVGEDVLEQQGHCFDESGKHLMWRKAAGQHC